MTVLLPNARLGLRRRIEDAAPNDWGEVVSSEWAPPTEMLDGRTKENADGTWALGVDPSLWPIRQGDLIVSADRAWLVQTANLIQNNYDSTVDWIRVAALERDGTATEPGGAEFVGR